ncbi:hypothetical protein PDR5_42550 [Pseudomonas sp. DR 5-09]|nr:hypothetical protein PDR5_42550 [Pseudomonas sp. DR 5-09]
MRHQALASLHDAGLAEQIAPCDLAHGGQTRRRRHLPLHDPLGQPVNNLLYDRHHCLSVNSQFHEHANSCPFLLAAVNHSHALEAVRQNRQKAPFSPFETHCLAG